MKQQQGAALVIAMLLLAGALMLGISGMQSALIDERLAGNYRASVLAQMAAESGVIARGSESSESESSENDSSISCEALRESVKNDTVESGRFSEFKPVDSLEESGRVVIGYYYAKCQHDEVDYELMVGQVKNRAEDPVSDFIAAYYYLFHVSHRGEDDQSSDNGTVFGNGALVAGSGGIELTGNAEVSGGLVASGDVEIRGGASPPDSIDAAGSINSPRYWDEEQTENFRENVSFESMVSDPLSIDDVYATLDSKTQALTQPPYDYDNVRVGRWPLVDATISGSGLVGFNESATPGVHQVMAEAVNYDVSEVPKIDGDYPVIRTRDFNQTKGSLTVTGDAVLIVDGDLTLGGGGDEGLLFEGDSSLTVLVTGDVDLKSSLQMQNLSVQTESGKPRFAIYSLGESVKIGGHSQVIAMIYAPFAAVEIGGSGGLRGALWGGRIDVRGAGRIIGEGSFVDGASNGSTRAGNGSWTPFN